MTSETSLQGINSILLVCMGNICRSPSAEAVLRHKANALGLSLTIDSAGTVGAHAKEKPDHRSIKAGSARGYSFDGIKARKVTLNDFADFDLILAMDEENLAELKQMAPQGTEQKVHLLLDFASELEERQVPDPYYGGAKGFDYVLDLVEAGSDAVLEKIT